MADQYQSNMKQLSDITRRIAQADTFTHGWHSNIRRWRRRYNFDHYDTRALPNEKRYTDPVLTNVVDLAVGIMQSNEWIWRSKGLRPSEDEQTGTSLIEKSIAGFIDINSDRYQYDHKYETNLNFVRDGGAVLLGVWDTFIHDNCYEIKPELFDANTQEVVNDAKLYYDLPLRIEVIDPLQIGLVPGGPKRWLSVNRSEDMTVYDAEETYQVELDAFKGRSQQQKKDTRGKFYDYWELAYELQPADATDYEGLESEEDVEKYPMRKSLVVRNAIMYNNEFIRPLRIMEGYDDLPYTISFYNPASREKSDSWHSIISPLENPVMELEDTTNMRKRLMLMYSGLPLIARTASGKTITLDKSIGKVVNLRAGEDLGFPEWRGTPPDMDKHLEFARSRIQQSGFSDVMYGEGSSQSSGYGLSMLTDQNRIRLEPAITHLENMWTWAARKWVKLANNFIPNDYMELYGHIRGVDFAEVVRGSELDKYTIRCEIKPEFPNEKVRNHAMATQVMGILPSQIIMEDYLGIQQPDDARIMKIQEMAESDPIVVQYTIMRELTKRAATGDKVAQQSLMMMQQKLAQVNAPNPQAGMPNPEQLLGTAGADGMPDEPKFSGKDDMEAIQRAGNAAPTMEGTVNNV